MKEERFPWNESLADLVDSGVVPDALWLPGCEDLFQVAHAHTVAGESSAGKSFVCLALGVGVLKAGRVVVYADQENGPNVTADRLIGLGVKASLVRSGLRYLAFPEPNENETREFVRRIKSADPALVIFDSGPDYYAAAGFDENDNTSYTAWATAVPQDLARSGHAVVLIEPLNAAGDTHRGRGATAKRYKTDIQLHLEKVVPFGRSKLGEVRLTVKKDRTGHRVEGEFVSFEVGGDGSGRTVFERQDTGTVAPSLTKQEQADQRTEAWCATALATARQHAPDEEHALSTNQLVELMGTGRRADKLLGVAWASDGLRPDRPRLAKRPGRGSSVDYWYLPVPTGSHQFPEPVGTTGGNQSPKTGSRSSRTRGGTGLGNRSGEPLGNPVLRVLADD